MEILMKQTRANSIEHHKSIKLLELVYCLLASAERDLAAARRHVDKALRGRRSRK